VASNKARRFSVVSRLLANRWIRQRGGHMANDRNPMRERNPMQDDEELGRTTGEDIIGDADDEEFDDLDEMEEDDDLEA
jgi:hypothetical protein